MNILRAAQKFADAAEKVLKIAVTASLAAIAGLVNIAVFFRYVLNSPLSWTNELAQYLLIFTVVFASAIALRHGMFVNVQILVEALPPGPRNAFAAVSRLCIAALLAVCVLSPEALIEKALRTATISPAMGLPMSVVYRIMQAGFAVMLAFVAFGQVDHFLRRRADGAGGEVLP